MGRNGEGELFQKILKANGLFIAQPVYCWGMPSATHTFLERLYPFSFTNEINGMPFAFLSQASNQGMARLANREMSKFAFIYRFKYVGGLPVHMAYFEEAMVEARYLGKKLAEAALIDAKGRKKISDLENYLSSANKPWKVLVPYLDNLTNGTFNYEESIIEKSLKYGTFKKKDAIELLKKAGEELKRTLLYYHLNENLEAIKHLVKTSAYWTQATYKEFGEDVVKVKLPEVYKSQSINPE
jgi:multimeric flavodoxin WrbA